MKSKVRLSDGREIPLIDLGKLDDGTLVDYSPTRHGEVPRALQEGGWQPWQGAQDLKQEHAVLLNEKEIQDLTSLGIIREVSFDPEKKKV